MRLSGSRLGQSNDLLAVGIWPGWLGYAAAFPDPVAQASEHLVGAVHLVAYVGESGADGAEVGSPRETGIP